MITVGFLCLLLFLSIYMRTGLLQLSHLGEIRNYIKKSSHEIRELRHINSGVFLRILRDHSYRSLFGCRSINSTKLEHFFMYLRNFINVSYIWFRSRYWAKECRMRYYLSNSLPRLDYWHIRSSDYSIYCNHRPMCRL